MQRLLERKLAAKWAALDALATCRPNELVTIARVFTEVNVAPGTTLIRQGDWPGRQVFLVVEGEVSIRRDGEEVTRVGRGRWLGETALMEKRPRNATVTTVTPTRLLAADRRGFYSALHLDGVRRGLGLTEPDLSRAS